MELSKNIGRLVPVVKNAVVLLLPSLLNYLLSVVVIRLYDVAWWGHIVELQLIYYFVTSFCAWGNKDYLLKVFSLDPAHIRESWMRSLCTRFLLLCIPGILLLFTISADVAVLHVGIWVAARFFTQSYEALMVYQRRFNIAIWTELAAMLVLGSGLFVFRNTLTFDKLLWCLTASNLLRALILSRAFRTYYAPVSSECFSLKELSASFIFMLLSFMSLLQAKTDLVVFSILMSKADLAEYNIISILLILIQTSIGFIIYPYAKVLYRLRKSTLRKMSRKLLLYGIPVTISGLIVMYVILRYVYGFDTPPAYYLPGLLFVLAGFWYAPMVFYMYKQNRQIEVALISVAGVATNAAMCFTFIPSLGILGALMSMAGAQLVMLVLYEVRFISNQKGTAALA